MSEFHHFPVDNIVNNTIFDSIKSPDTIKTNKQTFKNNKSFSVRLGLFYLSVRDIM